jgi:hypothetical protein
MVHTETRMCFGGRPERRYRACAVRVRQMIRQRTAQSHESLLRTIALPALFGSS